MPDLPSSYPRPGFVVGVTGHMDLDPDCRPAVEAAVRRVFDWIVAPPRHRDTALGSGLGLKNTPLVLLTSLAPGADQWVAQVAQAMEIRVVAALPFCKEQYLRASTFQQNGGVKDRQASRFLQEFPDRTRHPGDSAFLVRLLDETDLDATALRLKHEPILTDPRYKQERDRRYLAAGEYVAAYSDILLALTDKAGAPPPRPDALPGTAPGALEIVEMKRRGLTPGLLPVQSALSWLDDGPVIHINAPRPSRPLPGEATTGCPPPSAPRPAGEIEILYPYGLRPESTQEAGDNDPASLAAGHDALRQVVEPLERFNREETLLHPGAEQQQAQRAREAAELARMLAPLESFDETGEAATTGSAHDLSASLDRLARLRRRAAIYNAHYDRLFNRQKRLLFWLAFCSALLFSLGKNWDVADPALQWLSGLFLALASVVTLSAWTLYFFHIQRSKAGSLCDDYRALAEGLRVQFYWTACGSGKSVASNYLLRQRGELSWVRGAISSTAFPYEEPQACFRRLPLAGQAALLASIGRHWLGEQSQYLQAKVAEITRRGKSCSGASRTGIGAGLVLTNYLFLAGYATPLALTGSRALATFAAGGCLLLAGVLLRRVIARAEHRAQVVWSYVRIAAWSLLLVGTGFGLGGTAGWLPSAAKLASLLRDLAFMVGVLCASWSKMNFFTENIRRYTSMVSLFNAGARRLDDQLRALATAGHDLESETALQAVSRAQEVLVVIGKEALSENTEWLITHRIRPLKPIKG